MYSASYIPSFQRGGGSLALCIFLIIGILSSCSQEPLIDADQSQTTSLFFLKGEASDLQSRTDEEPPQEGDYVNDAVATRDLINALKEGQYLEVNFEASEISVAFEGMFNVYSGDLSAIHANQSTEVHDIGVPSQTSITGSQLLEVYNSLSAAVEGQLNAISNTAEIRFVRVSPIVNLDNGTGLISVISNVGDERLQEAPDVESFIGGPWSFEPNIACGIDPQNPQYADIQITNAVNRRTAGDFVHDASFPFPARVVGRLGIVVAVHGGTLTNTVPNYLSGALDIFEPTGFITGTTTYAPFSTNCDVNSNRPNNGQYRIHATCSGMLNELCFNTAKQSFYFDSHINIGNTRAKAIINSTFPGKTFRIGGLVRGTISNGGTQNPLESFRSYTTVWVYARDFFEGAVLPEMVRIP